MREQRRIISRLQATHPSSDSCLGEDNLDETVADASQLQPSNDFYHRLVSVNVSFLFHSFSFFFTNHLNFVGNRILLIIIIINNNMLNTS